MDQASSETRAAAVVQRLADATNAHDLEALVGCFAPDYRNETPVHPARGFVGRDQVRRNWEQIFGAVKDVRAELVESLGRWRHGVVRMGARRHSTGRHRTPASRGGIFIVRDDSIESARFYLEPVDADATGDRYGSATPSHRSRSDNDPRRRWDGTARHPRRRAPECRVDLDVRVLTRDAERAAHLPSSVDVCVGDVRSRDDVDRAARGASTIVSAVHGFPGSRRESPTSVDRDGNANLTDAAATVHADVVLVSGVGVASDSSLELFRMKFAAEQYLAASKVPATIVRATPRSSSCGWSCWRPPRHDRGARWSSARATIRSTSYRSSTWRTPSSVPCSTPAGAAAPSRSPDRRI